MKTLIVFLFFLCLPGLTEAKLYKWVDENGVTHFSNTAPPQDTTVHTRDEVKGAASAINNSGGLDQVLHDYKKDSLQNDIDEFEKRSKTRSGSQNNRSIDLYEGWVNRDKETIKRRKEELDDVERESYSDSQAHNAKIRYYENRVKDAELELEKDQRRLERAKNGQ